MKFGNINHFLIMGGGYPLMTVVTEIKKMGYNLDVITSERHLDEVILEKNTLKDFFEANEIRYLISKDINSDDNVISKITNETLGISLQAAWIFKPDFIKKFDGRLVNSHGSRLPQDRGGGGFSWRIMRNDRMGFNLFHKVTPGIDDGCLITLEEFLYPISCRIPSDYYQYSFDQYLSFFTTFLKKIIENYDFATIDQAEYLSVYWPRLSTDIHGFIDWSWSLKDIEQFICAFDSPYCGASTFINNERVRVKKCFATVNDGCFHPFQKGIVYRISGNIFYVATEQGSLIIQSVIDENGEDYSKKIRIGDRFFTPIEYIEKAKQFRAIYTSIGLKK